MSDSAREWFAASELAGLAGMPSTERGVRIRALAEGWPRRPKEGRGGGYEYNAASLPEATREALVASATARPVASLEKPAPRSSLAAPAPCSVVASAEPFYSAVPAETLGRHAGRRLALADQVAEEAARSRRLQSLKQSNGLSRAAQTRIDAKLAILRALETFHRESGLTLERAEHAFAERYNRGDIDAGRLAHEVVARVAARTLRQWRAELKREGLTRLAGKYGNRQGTSKIDRDPRLRDFVIGLLVAKPHVRATHVLEGLKARFTTAEIPSLRSLERWMNEWKAAHAQTFLAISNPDAWKSRNMVAFGSHSEGVARLNQRWELDSTPADVMLTDGRHTVLGVIDVYSRRARLLVAKTSKAAAIATLVRHALLDWGVPEEAKTDNGKDYTSHHVTRVFASLDVQHTLCPPFQAWHKPHIERFFRTFAHDLVELLAGFIGHNVAERKSLEARQSFADRLMRPEGAIEISLSAEELQAFCDRWCEDIYMHRAHDGLGGKTPFEIVGASRDTVRRVTDERALDILLAEAPDNGGLRTVQKKGIALDNAWFIAPELEGFVGQAVQVRYDPQDLGRVYVFGGPDSQFICIAECPERTGIDRREVALRARQQQTKRVQEERRALKAIARAVNVDDIVNDILRARAQAAGKLALFPAPREAHASKGLTAAAEAAAARHAPRRTTADLMSRDEFAAARAKLEVQSHLPAQPIFNTPFERAYWLACQAHARALTEEEAEYLARFRTENRDAAASIDEMIDLRFGARPGPAAAG